MAVSTYSAAINVAVRLDSRSKLISITAEVSPSSSSLSTSSWQSVVCDDENAIRLRTDMFFFSYAFHQCRRVSVSGQFMTMTVISFQCRNMKFDALFVYASRDYNLDIWPLTFWPWTCSLVINYYCVDCELVSRQWPRWLCVVDEDECMTGRHRCHVGQQCRNLIGGYECVALCPPGFTQHENGSCVGQ